MRNEVIESSWSIPAPTHTLPPRVVAWVRMLGGTVEHPGQPVRWTMAPGAVLPDEIREEARSLLSTLTSDLSPEAPFGGRPAAQARIGIVTTLLMGLGGARASDETAEAKLDLYEVAVADCPAWAVAAASHRWVRGQCPESIEKNPNYNFPPSPATLRALAEWEIDPVKRSARDLERLVSAIPVERAMDPRPLDKPALGAPGAGIVPSLRRM